MTSRAAQRRLSDPDDHFPYRADGLRDLLDEDGPAGPGGPDDDRARISDFTSAAIVDASEAYVHAQAAYLEDPGDATRADYQEAARKLAAARAEHRANRPSGPTIVAQRAD